MRDLQDQSIINGLKRTLHVKKIVVFYDRLSVLEMLRKDLGQARTIEGNQDFETRQAIVDEWERELNGILFLQITTAGIGLRIHADIIYFAIANVMEENRFLQAKGRIVGTRPEHEWGVPVIIWPQNR